METSKEKAIIAKSLILFVKTLIGSKVTVETTNSSNVTGYLLNVDAYMNLTLNIKSNKEDDDYTSTYFIKGPKVRFVKYNTNNESEITMMKKQVDSFSYRVENSKRTAATRQGPK